MEITFADGTRIEVTESALNDFVLHDLKWVEFVHGSASQKASLLNGSGAQHAKPISQVVKRCPAPSPRGC